MPTTPEDPQAHYWPPPEAEAEQAEPRVLTTSITGADGSKTVETSWRIPLTTEAKSPHIDRHVCVEPYKGEVRVDIRGWPATKTGGTRPKPGQGVSLTVKEFKCLVSFIPQIEKQIKEQEEQLKENRRQFRR
ncbi:hypothetical protein F4821DRAFT_216935 [Hypoxylon rubiginosum]|uniref:Uncharacterized protein n=1 Tax=Hypoxylon rubiginosum TaxID=110542 RepID=A0ACC0CPU1_9PEZI|nr:hypothetical protein F4821DRAFT_216935 [Hypoxylon rubiginosum]